MNSFTSFRSRSAKYSSSQSFRQKTYQVWMSFPFRTEQSVIKSKTDANSYSSPTNLSTIRAPASVNSSWLHSVLVHQSLGCRPGSPSSAGSRPSYQ